MISEQRSRNVLFAGLLVVAAVGCSDPSDTGAMKGGSTGIAGGAGAGGSSAMGGTSQTSSGGVTGSAGSSGQVAAGGSGNSSGASPSGGSSPGGMLGTGGVAASSSGSGGAAGASAERGGSAGAAGQASSGSGQGGAFGGVSGGSGQGGLGKGGGGQGGLASGGGGQAGRSGSGGQAGATAGQRSISFGTLLDAQAVISSAEQLAKSVGNPNSPQWRAKGDQHRTYRFAEANKDEPYRISVPSDWDGKASLPLAMFLHGAGSDENSYLDQNNKQLVTLAQQHGYLLVSPLGDSGAYGNFLRLTAPFGNEAAAAALMAQVTAESERSNELSEKDIINVLELVLNEYPIDRAAMFLFGHSMGSGGTWYIGGKYASYWKGIAPMSGPFVQKTGYPWDSVRPLSIFVTEGTQAPSLDASRLLRDWLTQNGFKSQYLEVNADHGGMIKLVVPQVFDFFDSSR